MRIASLHWGLQRVAAGRVARWFYYLQRGFSVLTMGYGTFQLYVFCAQPIPSDPNPEVRPDPNTVVEPLTPSHPHFSAIPRPAQTIESRFAAGAKAVVVIVKGTFAGMMWWSTREHHEDEVRCRYVLPQDGSCCWDFDVLVKPAFRLGRTMGRLWRAANDILHHQGVKWSLSRISLSNTASLLSHARLGAVPVGWGVFLKFGMFQISWLSESSRLHFSWREADAPAVHFKPPPEHAASEEAAALVIGLDSHGVAEARALTRAGIPVYAVEADSRLPGYRTRFVRQVFPIAAMSGPALTKELIRVRRQLLRHDRVVLFPINDNHTELIARNLSLLGSHFIVPWADAAQEVLTLQDKSELEKASREKGLLYPRSAVFNTIADAGAAAAFRFPVIIKPVKPLSSFKTEIARSPSALSGLLQRYARDLPILGQEYIAGGDDALYFGALVLDHGRVLYGMVGRKVESYPRARGQTTVAEVVDEPAVLDITRRFFSSSRISGPVSLELKRDRDGSWWVIEPTVGRTDFWVELCIHSGFNQPALVFELAAGRPLRIPAKLRPTVWFDTERDPTAYFRLRLRRLFRHHDRGQGTVQFAFPYAGHMDPLVMARAFTRHGVRASMKLLRGRVA